jgi:Cu2+-exporting ATPase
MRGTLALQGGEEVRPISAGLLYPILYLQPEFAALAMSMSSVIISVWSYI